jgi:hypothetical protein
MCDPKSNNERLAAMKPRKTEPSWEEKGMALLSEFKNEWRENPVNMTCMVIFGLVVLGLAIYGASYIAPSFDPSYY